jgi:hypothetical protein
LHRDGDAVVGRPVAPAQFVRVQGRQDRIVGWNLPSPMSIESRSSDLIAPLTALATAAAKARGDDWSFHYFLALEDRGATAFLQVETVTGGVRVECHQAELIAWGDSRDAADRFVSLFDRWCALGRPMAAVFESRFLPVHRNPGSITDGWVIDRIDHSQVVRLQP